MATLRGLTVVGEQIQRLGWERPGETPELVDRAEQMVFDLAQHRIRGSFEHIEMLVRESFEQITRMYESGGEMTGTPTGFRDLDQHDVRPPARQPGRSSPAARAWASRRSRSASPSNLALHHGIPVAVFTLEMSKLEVAQRLMCSEGRVELQRLRTGRLTNDDWPRLVKACDALDKAPIYVDDTRLTTMLEIRGKARRLKAREPKLGADRHRLPPADELGLERREPRAGGLADLPLAEGARRRPRGAGGRAVAALARGREPHRQAAAALRPSRVGLSDRRHARLSARRGRLHGRSASSKGRSGFRVLAVDTETWKLEPRAVTNAFATGDEAGLQADDTPRPHDPGDRQPQVPRVRRVAAARRPRPGMRIAVPRTLAGAARARR